MPTAPKLPLKLHERLGADAMTELLTLFGDLGQADARLEAGLADVKEQVADLKQDVTRQVADLKQDVTQQMATFKLDVTQQMAGLRQDVSQQIADVKQQIADLKPQIAGVQAELIKWTFLFWLGTIGIVLLLIRFPG